MAKFVCAEKDRTHTEKGTGLVQTSTVSLDIIKVVAKLQHEETGLHVKIQFLIANILKGWPFSSLTSHMSLDQNNIHILWILRI